MTNQYSQQCAFCQNKQELSKTLVLALYDPIHDTIVSADASSYGLETVLMHKQPDYQQKSVCGICIQVINPAEEKYAHADREGDSEHNLGI